MNSESRNFLESAVFEEKGGKIIVKYRDNETEYEKSLDEIIKELEVKSEERKSGWAKGNAE